MGEEGARGGLVVEAEGGVVMIDEDYETNLESSFLRRCDSRGVNQDASSCPRGRLVLYLTINHRATDNGHAIKMTRV